MILLAREGIPPGEEGYYIVYSHDAIFLCEDCDGGFAEKRRRDSFDFEDVHDQDDHYALDAESVARLREGLTFLCPKPLAPDCACAAHTSLRASWHVLPRLGCDRDVQAIPRIEIQSIRDAPTLRTRSCNFTQCYKSGKEKARGQLKNGQLTGPWVFWHENGMKKAEGGYRSDLRQGMWTEWSERGVVCFQRNFKDGYTVPS
ncbi:MAG TPA: hypothetical protein VG028_14610 [Terriglobia bacterium]|nr:hypothetical protein [Terriglobia bacterium]